MMLSFFYNYGVDLMRKMTLNDEYVGKIMYLCLIFLEHIITYTMIIKVLLESKCTGCNATYVAVQKAAESLDSTIQIEAVRDVKTILSYRVWRLPALVINEEVVSFGKNLTEQEALSLILQKR